MGKSRAFEVNPLSVWYIYLYVFGDDMVFTTFMSKIFMFLQLVSNLA